MAVGFDVASESHTGTTGNASAASFTWNHAGGGSARGALVFVFGVVTNALPPVTSVTYGSTTMTEIPYSAIDTDTEPGSVKAFYLDNVATGTQAVVVNRTNNTHIMYAVCYTVTAAGATEVYLAGVQTKAGSTATATGASSTGTGTGTLALLAVDDGSPGTNSLRFMGRYQGTSSVTAAGSGSLAGPSIDFGLYVIDTFYESAAGQGARNVGGATITDDVAAIALAVREKPPVTGSFTANAVIKKTQTPTFSANAVIKRTMPIAGASFTADAWKSVAYIFTDKKADAVIRRTMPIAGATLAANAVVKRTMPIAGASFAADSVRLKASGTLTLTANAVVKRTMPIAGAALTANAVVLKSSGTLTFSADAVIRKTFDFSFTADAVQLKSITVAGVTGETPGPPAYGTVDAVIAALLVVVEVTAPADAIKLRTFHFGSGVW